MEAAWDVSPYVSPQEIPENITQGPEPCLPLLSILSRKGSRSITNEKSLIKLGKSLGFRVQSLKIRHATPLPCIWGKLRGKLGMRKCKKWLSGMNENPTVGGLMLGVHGAALTSFLFLRENDHFLQVILSFLLFFILFPLLIFIPFLSLLASFCTFFHRLSLFTFCFCLFFLRFPCFCHFSLSFCFVSGVLIIFRGDFQFSCFQIVPLGLARVSESCFGTPAKKMNLHYWEYPVSIEESTLGKEWVFLTFKAQKLCIFGSHFIYLFIL